MYTGRTSQGDVSIEWMNKTDRFLKLAFGKAARYPKMALCPCSKCGNRRMQNQEVMVYICTRMGLRRTTPGGSTMVKPIV